MPTGHRPVAGRNCGRVRVHAQLHRPLAVEVLLRCRAVELGGEVCEPGGAGPVERDGAEGRGGSDGGGGEESGEAVDGEVQAGDGYGGGVYCGGV